MKLSEALTDEMRQALAFMAREPLIIDLKEKHCDQETVVCALLFCFQLSNKGLCTHEWVSDTAGCFTLTPAGRAALAEKQDD